MLSLSGAFSVCDWSTVPAEVHRGETGEAYWKTQFYGEVRVRHVRYSPGYLADHWCTKGHGLLVLDGVLVTELEDGTEVTLASGMSYTVPDGGPAHRSRTLCGAGLFIVD